MTTETKLLELRRISVGGAPRSMGRDYGEALRPEIRRFVEGRVAAMHAYFADRGRRDAEKVLACGSACLAVAERWDPEGTEEHFGIAEGAGLDARTLYAATNMTDIRDVVLMPSAVEEGCSALVLPPELSVTGQLIAAQTWDLNPEDLDFVVAVERSPAAGPKTWSITCAGALSLIGMNEHGVSVGTTNIKLQDNRVGVGYLSVLHRAIRSRSRTEALESVRTAPRAAAHTYWIADEAGASELECSAQEAVERVLEKASIVRTNHCIAPSLRAAEGEPTGPSTQKRLEKLRVFAARGGHDLDTIREVFSDRSEGIDSINRYAEDGQGTSTNACIVCFPSERRMMACRGSADRGQWVELGFG